MILSFQKIIWTPNFKGKIDEFRMYNHVLNQDDVRSLYSDDVYESTFAGDSCIGCPAGTI